MDKYFKIQRLVEMQKERKEAVEKVFLEVLGFVPKFEIDFKLEGKMDSYTALGMSEADFVVRVQVKDKSSVKFVVDQNKQKILEMYSKIFAMDILLLN